jgi:hypothetical protein
LSREIIESSEKLLHALLITQISKDDYRDFETFSEISKKRLDKNEIKEDNI